MSWDEIKRGYGKVAHKADGLRKDAMGKVEQHRGHSPQSSTGAAGSDDGDGPAPTPPPRLLPPRTGAPQPARPIPAASTRPALSNGSSGGTGIFVNLSEEDKEALYALLDEYFESRPHLLAAASDGDAATGSTDPVANLAAKHGPALASAAIRNPAITAAAMRSQGVSPGMADSINKAAAGAAAKKPPPAPPTASSSGTATPPQRGPKGAAGLTTGKSIGNMPTTSSKAAFGHILTTTGKEKPPVDNSFSNSSAISPRSSATPPPVRAAAVPAPPTRSHGIGRARALYDYQGTDDGDLSFSEGDEITVLEHVDEAWHRGELANGESGIYPANYTEALG